MCAANQSTQALNALCDGLMKEVISAAQGFDADPKIGAMVLTGSEKAFAAGADISEMQSRTFPETYSSNMFGFWGDLANVSKPIIAAVNGYALGGGCELAMQCDMIIAGEKAAFGQPEIKLGTIPGGGGTQRLLKAVGKAKAMDLILTGRMMKAEEAERSGLVARIVPADELVSEAVSTAATIASFSKPAVAMCKEAVNAAAETTLTEGLRWERRMFHATFGTNDQKEGMAAFLEKRDAKFTDS